MALVYNCHRTKGKAKKPSEFNPHCRPKPIRVGIGALKEIFIDGRMPSVLTEERDS